MGHIHVGYDNPTIEVNNDIILMMDAVLGLQSLFLCKDTRRRELYGKAGCLRTKSFGVEYRTLSNFWIHDESLIEWAYESTLEAIDLINTGVSEDIKQLFGTAIQTAIDENNKELATEILQGIEDLVASKNKVTE